MGIIYSEYGAWQSFGGKCLKISVLGMSHLLMSIAKVGMPKNFYSPGDKRLSSCVIIISPAFMGGVYSFRLSVRMSVCSFMIPSRSWNYFKVLGKVSQGGYISPTTHQKTFIFGP